MGDNVYLSDEEQRLILSNIENEIGHLREEYNYQRERGQNTSAVKKKLDAARNIQKKLR